MVGATLTLLAEVNFHGGDSAEALRLLTEAVDHADDPRTVAAIELVIGYTYANAWEHEASAAHAARGLELVEASGDRPLIAQALAATVMYRFLCGGGVDWTTLERSLKLEDADAVVALEARPAVIAALLQLYVGDHDLARDGLRTIAQRAADRGDESAACEPLTTAIEEGGLAEPVPAFFLPDALEALIALGELGRADVLTTALEQRAHALDRTWALATGGRCRALLHAARGDLDAARTAADRAAAAHERIDMPFERARTQLVTGVIQRRCRQRALARSSFEEALKTFERLGTPLWADQARQQLDRVGTRQSSGTQLTATEQRVAELAGSGLTNREVASTLFISPKTVEANLSRVCVAVTRDQSSSAAPQW
ncbi:MAG TPA: helix-turn-helix transcriptional regulator [Euzebyales bacterium]